ncbi:MAG: hypothetical protein V1895_00205 [Parcubacteria group bacterium]
MVQYLKQSLKATIDARKKRVANDDAERLFINDLIATDRCAIDCLVTNAPVFSKSVPGEVMADGMALYKEINSFYFFAAKMLRSGLLIFDETLGAQGSWLSKLSFSCFHAEVQKHENVATQNLYTQFGHEINWMYRNIIRKRNKLVEHRDDVGGKYGVLFPVHYLIDGRQVFAYQTRDSDELSNKLNAADLRGFGTRALNKLKLHVPADYPVTNLAAMCAYYEVKFSRQEQEEFEKILDGDYFCALPINKEILDKVDNFLSSLFGEAK